MTISQRTIEQIEALPHGSIYIVKDKEMAQELQKRRVDMTFITPQDLLYGTYHSKAWKGADIDHSVILTDYREWSKWTELQQSVKLGG